MSLRPEPFPSIPNTTAAAVRAAFPKGNFYVDLGAAVLERTTHAGPPAAPAAWSAPRRAGGQRPMCWTPAPGCSGNALYGLGVPRCPCARAHRR